MKKLSTLAVMAVMALQLNAQTTTTLPVPDKSLKMTLMEALAGRKSNREYAQEPVSDVHLATLLWAATGVNRPDSKKLTAPSAINAQDIRVYVCRQDGAYLYNPSGNTLEKVSSQDLRTALAGRQTAVATAPMFLLLVSDQEKFGENAGEHTQLMGAVDAGYVSQNIYLACTALGLHTVARATMEQEPLKAALGLTDRQILLINHPVGH